jgi:HK97 family phage major capsid protein
MAFSKIQEYIDTDDGTSGTLLIPQLIMPQMIAEVEKVLIPREVASIVWTPNMIQGSTFSYNLEDVDTMLIREVGEGAEIPMDNIDFSSTTVTPVKYGVAIRITREMMEDSQFELLNRNIARAGRRLAENENSLILTALDGTANTVTGGAALTIANITEAMQNVEDNDFVPTDCLVGNEAANDLRNIDTFVEADKSGSTEMLNRGFIGRIFGMNVLRFTSSLRAVPSANHKKYIYVLDRAETYGIAIKRDITVENFTLPSYDMSGAAITQRIAVTLLRDTAVSRVTTT